MHGKYDRTLMATDLQVVKKNDWRVWGGPGESLSEFARVPRILKVS